jgi:RNA polymerase-interacting CarD/CdnL/TRCF family regulator
MTKMISRDTDIPKEHKFEIGDAVVHPIRGAGIVTDIAKLKRHEGSRAYYKIKLLNHVRTHLLLPVRDTLAQGLRRAIRHTRLDRVWRVLRSTPDQCHPITKSGTRCSSVKLNQVIS